MENTTQITVISVGGSLIVPDTIDTSFLKDFKEFIEAEVKQGKKFILVTGGGKICRRYNTALENVNPNITNEDKDWLGCKVTQLNATLLKYIFGNIATFIPNFNPKSEVEWKTPVYIGAGYEPGHSSDMDAVLLAHNVGAKKMINLSNIEYLYEKDPRDDPNAKKIISANWDELIAILPDSWEAGLNAPFDPMAARKAKEFALELAIISGQNFKGMKSFMEDQEFIGTKVHP